MGDKPASHDTEQLQKSRELLRMVARKLERQPMFLLVEDVRDDALMICRELDEFFQTCHVLTAKTGTEALAVLRNFKCDAIFLDLRLDGLMDGPMLLKHLRELYSSIPVIIVTGLPSDSRVVDEALSMGAVYFVAKPVSQSDLNTIFNKP
ncbi:MAG: response regulator [Patescibacteria group bacterium]|nr:response regulator [Patescibacteria group bacterium]